MKKLAPLIRFTALVPTSLLITALLTAVSPALAQHAPPPPVDDSRPDPRTLSAADWQSDLRFLAAAIEERHPDPFENLSKAEFDAAVEKLHDRLPELGYPETLVELNRLVAGLGQGNGHTRVRLGAGFISGQLPLRFWFFSDGLWVRSAAPEHAALAGKRVVGFGGLPVEEALELVHAIVAADNEFDRRLKIPTYMVMPEILQGLGLASEAGVVIEVAVSTEEGTTEEGTPGTTEEHTILFVPTPEGAEHSIVALAHDPVGLGAGADWVDMRPADVPAPLYLSRPQESYWMEELEEGRVLYAQYNAVRNDEGKPTLAEFFGELMKKAEPETVEKLILDVRLNGGGNNFLNRPFIHGLIRSDTKNLRGRTYVLISRNTFSAAQNLVTKLSHETSAVFVGEPTGGSPNHYGDARRVTLPRSGLDVSIATLFWQDGGPMDRRSWVPPDIAVDMTAADYAAGRDPVLEAVLAVDPATVRGPFGDTLRETFETQGFEAVVEVYEKYKADPAHRYVGTERTINRAGYYLLGHDMAEEAVRLFELNVEAYPESWNVYDSLAEGLMKAGRFGAAIESYENSLRLNPENANAARMIEHMRAGTGGDLD